MNGHTSNRMVAVSLASRYLRSLRSLEILPEDDKISQSYHQGQMDAAEEVAILLYVNEQFDEIVAREKAHMLEKDMGGAPAGT